MAEPLGTKIFSTAIVTIVREICAHLYRTSRFDTKKEVSLDKINDATEREPTKTSSTEAGKIPERFNTVLKLMNEGSNYKKYSISKLAQILDLNRISDLEDKFLGKSEPAFDFMKVFCEEFGVYNLWLTDGECSPFHNGDKTMYHPSYEVIDKINPERIYFIRAKSSGEAFAILKLKDWKYLSLHRSWPIHSGTGCGGQSQIFDFYRLILKLEKSAFYNKLSGIHIGEKEFRLLHDGSTFPGKFLDRYHEDPWWSDFTDINHEYSRAEDYQEHYGENFISAQKVVQFYLLPRT